MAQQVRGVVARSKGAPVSIETIVVPDPGPGEAVVKVQACGVCHTDLHYREGGINDDFPFLLGHEAAGVVESVGEGVTNVKPGDFVILNWRAVCGTCRSCLRGRPWLCFNTFNATQKMTLADGTVLSPALGIGAFVEKTLVAAGQCTKVDPEVPATTAGLLGCGVMAGIGAAINTGNVGRGDSVAVFGCGGVGDAAIAGARLAGAHTIIAVDIDDRKLEWAKEFGATHTVQLTDQRPGRVHQVGHRRQRRRRVHRGDRQPRRLPPGVRGPRPRRHRGAGRRAPSRHEAGAAVHRGLRPWRRAEVVVVRRLPAVARLPDAGHAAPAGSPCRSTSSSARRSPSTPSRRPSTRWSAAKCCAASSCCDGGGVTIELVTTEGIFALDGGQWEVTNNIWLVGDDREVLVFDAAHDAEPIIAAIHGRRVRAHRVDPRSQRPHQRRGSAPRRRRCAGVAARCRPHVVGRRVAGRGPTRR